MITHYNVALPALPSWSSRLDHHVLEANLIHRILRVRTIDSILQSETAEPPKHPCLIRSCLLQLRKRSAHHRDQLQDGPHQEEKEHHLRGLAAKAQATEDPPASVPELRSSDVRHQESPIAAIEIPRKAQAIHLKRQDSMNTGSDLCPEAALSKRRKTV
jgi:hypothetical protein